jgi:hypothetical protein
MLVFNRNTLTAVSRSFKFLLFLLSLQPVASHPLPIDSPGSKRQLKTVVSYFCAFLFSSGSWAVALRPLLLCFQVVCRLSVELLQPGARHSRCQWRPSH